MAEGREGMKRQEVHVLPVIVTTTAAADEEVGVDEGRPRTSSAGHDSDPPIENDNPDEEGGEDCFSSNNNNLSSVQQKNEFESARRRAQSLSHHRKRKKSAHNADSNYVPPYKKRFFRRQPSVLPSKFLLGGNIRDPLNLASLSSRSPGTESNKPSPSPVASPFPGHTTEVPVFIPKNPNDPLGLTTKTPETVGDIAAVGVSACRKHRHRRRNGRKRTESECSLGPDCPEKSGAAAQTGQTNEEPGPSSQTVEEAGRKRNRSASEPALALHSHSPKPGVSKESKADCTETSINRSPVKERKEDEDTPQSFCAEGVKKDDVKKEEAEEPVSAGKQQYLPEEDENSRLTTDDKHGSTDSYDPYHKTSSDYVPLSTYSHSPFALDTTDYLNLPPYESPVYSHFAYTPNYHMQPFSPPPIPEVPHFQRRMQVYTARPHHLSLQKAVFRRPCNRRRTRHPKDPIVSPVIPQPGCQRRRVHHHKKVGENKIQGGTSVCTGSCSAMQGASSSEAPKVVSAEPAVDSASSFSANAGKKYRQKDQVFQFGNYKRYYGYRTVGDEDPRLWVLKKENFAGKDILDIGCNTGHVTLCIARDFEPKRIHGIDIDYSLITVARKNIKHYMTRDPDNKDVLFPSSLPTLFGAVQPPPVAGETVVRQFPYNVSFAHENYVFTSDAYLDNVKPEYDVILCFSVTKWIHLNFGDEGMKRFFRRIFLHLKNDGILILEPQPWSSYSKKKKITEKIHKTYQSIKFFPEQFEDFLLKEVGFASVETLGIPAHHSKGFQRPLLLFTKKKQTTPRSTDTAHEAMETEKNKNSSCKEPPRTSELTLPDSLEAPVSTSASQKT